MSHLDEGTIHAWLDGALHAERAREVESHVRECPTCAAAVAEARGLIAASSRILSALDDVPANVLPAGSVAGPRSPAAPPRRLWRAAPWVTGGGIAAVLLAAIVLRTTRDTPNYAEQVSRMDVAQRSAKAALDTMVPAQTPQAAAARALEPRSLPVPGRGSSDAVATPATRDLAATSMAEVVPARVDRAAGAREQAAGAAGARTAAEPTRAEAGAIRQVSPQEEQMRRRAAFVPAPALDQIVVTGVDASVADRDSLPAGDLAGCYVFDPRGRVERLTAVAERLADPARARTAAVAAPPAAPAPVTARPAEFAESRRTLLIRLDTLRGRPGFIVRSATSDSSLGWWNRVARDSARVDLYTAGVLVLSPRQKVQCP